MDTPQGSVPIEDLRIGDEVLGLSENGELCTVEVVETYRVIQYDYYVINGFLKVTGTHPFSVEGSWVTAADLAVGDQLDHIQGDGQALVVETIFPVHFGVRAYNIEVDGEHVFFVEGVLVHNKGPNPQG